METIQEMLKTQKTSRENAEQVFDSLAPVDSEFMLGRWKGKELDTGHSLDGLLELSGWYGKLFLTPEEVHPLLFYGRNQTKLYAVNPKNVPLKITFPKTTLLGPVMKLLKPFLKTRRSRARLRMIEHRGKLTAAMAYDDLPILDYFRKIDENTVLGFMDMKGMPEPYFWIMERDDESTFRYEF